MEHSKHIIRAVLLLVMSAVGFVLVRYFAIPETFGDYGHYRAASVQEYRQYPALHGAPGACAECHDEEGETHAEGAHEKVPCETCHAPLGDHIDQSGEKFADMPKRRTYELCAWCHQKLVARPKDFPQVVIPDHVTEQGVEMSEEICLECHDDAHDPSLSE